MKQETGKLRGIEPNDPEVIRVTTAPLGILPLENHHVAGLCRRSPPASHVERVDMVSTNVLPVNGRRLHSAFLTSGRSKRRTISPHVHTPTPVSTVQGDSQLVGSS